MLEVQTITREPAGAGTLSASAQARHLIRRAARREPPLQSLRRSARIALEGLRTLLDAASPSCPGGSLDAARRRHMAMLAITTLSLECSCLRPDALPAATELGWRELRRRIAEAQLEARGAAVAADRELFDDYLASVDAGVVCADLRGQLARRLLATKD